MEKNSFYCIDYHDGMTKNIALINKKNTRAVCENWLHKLTAGLSLSTFSLKCNDSNFYQLTIRNSCLKVLSCIVVLKIWRSCCFSDNFPKFFRTALQRSFYKSSHFCKKPVLKNFKKSQENTCVRVSFLRPATF